ncbi:hypothetical protein NCS56_01029500 [Fusarium sp. Ph1]|nr:hypothetical protein NCS56_01029500 [Fusarium sp. Ph1]
MSRVKDFFGSHWFDPHWKTRVHIGMMVLIVAVIAFTGARAVKSIVFLIYQLLTDKVDRFRKWRSLKAYAILNTMEIVFWFVVIIITFMGISRFCQGASCAFAWFVALNGFLLMATSFWAAVICWKDHKYFKSTGVVRGTALPTHAMNSSAYSSQSAMK